MVQQLIYTSSQRLLEAGRSGFGTVSRSRSLSPLTVGAIERLSQFANLRGYDRKRLIFAHRRLTVANSHFHLLTSIRDAGSDYTGRTNHIAQHLIITPKEARRLASLGLNPADILGGFPWLNTWSGASKLLDDADTPDLGQSAPIRHHGERIAWTQATGTPLHARLLASSSTPKTGVIVVPDALSPLPLLAEALEEVESPWDFTFTTCLEQSDELGDFRWIVTPSSLAEPVKQRCGSRVFFRLDDPRQLPLPKERTRSTPTPTAVESSTSPTEAALDHHTPPAPSPKPASPDGRTYDRNPPLRPIGIYKKPPESPARTSRIALGALIGAAAAGLILLATFLIVRAGKGKDRLGSEKSNQGQSDSHSISPKLQTERENFIRKMKELGIKHEDATKLANNLNTNGLKDWQEFIETVHDWAADPKWAKLENISLPSTNGPQGAPGWVDTLWGNGDNGIIPRLLNLKKKLVTDSGSTEFWNEFTVLATDLDSPSLDSPHLAFPDLAPPDPNPAFGKKTPLPALAIEALERALKEIVARKDEGTTLTQSEAGNLSSELDHLGAIVKKLPTEINQDGDLVNLKEFIELSIESLGPLGKQKEGSPGLMKKLEGTLTENNTQHPAAALAKLVEAYRESKALAERSKNKLVETSSTKNTDQPSAADEALKIEYHLIEKKEFEAGERDESELPKKFDLLTRLIGYELTDKPASNGVVEKVFKKGFKLNYKKGNSIKSTNQLTLYGAKEETFWVGGFSNRILGVTKNGHLVLVGDDHFETLSITCDDAELHLAISTNKEDQSPIWGEFKFRLKKEGLNVRITGELAARIKAFKSDNEIKARHNKNQAWVVDKDNCVLKNFKLDKPPPAPKKFILKKTADNKNGQDALKEKLDAYKLIKDSKAKVSKKDKNALLKEKNKVKNELLQILVQTHPKDPEIEKAFNEFKGNDPNYKNLLFENFENFSFSDQSDSQQNALSSFADHTLKKTEDPQKDEYKKERESTNMENEKKVGAIQTIEIWTKDGTFLFRGTAAP